MSPVPPHKRFRPRSSEFEVDDRLAKSARQEKDAIRTKGRIFGRIGEMFRPFLSILKDGLARDLEGPDKVYSDLQTIHYTIYQELTKVAPGILDEIQRLGAEGSKIVATKLEAGRRGARSEDISSMKEKISGWRDFTTPYNPNQRSLLGFKHADCGRLLCPASMDWDDPSVRSRLRDGIIKAKPDDFPAFLYCNEQVNTDDLFDGFLKNTILVKGYLHVFRGPSTAFDSSRSGTRKGNAAAHSINKVTTPSIAYIATLIRFVLSDQPTFTAGGSDPGQWPFRKFYCTILEVIDAMEECDREDLLNWWNEKIFADIPVSEEVPDEPITMAARMKVQAAATKTKTRCGPSSV